MIQKIEELSMNALPALSTVFLNGWILRFANGYSKRANSVNPIYPCSTDIEKNIEICESLFRKNHLATVFKLTECTEAYKIDEILQGKGYVYEAKTNVMFKNISKFQIKEQSKKNAVIYKEFKDDWFEAFVHMNQISYPNAVTLHKMLQCIVPDTYYGYILEDGKIAAVALGVAERGYVGVYDVGVHKEKRRRGLGMKIMENLIYTALQDGCTHSYLQVIDSNEEAKALYEKLGYEKQYSYWYRVKNWGK